MSHDLETQDCDPDILSLSICCSACWSMCYWYIWQQQVV